MFTGIIQNQGIVSRVEQSRSSLVLYIESPLSQENLQLGESISVDGCCLTLSGIVKDPQARLPKGGVGDDMNLPFLKFDISPDTLKATTLKAFKLNQTVNLERALRVGDSLGGHWISGHIDAIGLAVAVEPHDDCLQLKIFIAKNDAHWVIPKGSLAINGVSLTIQKIHKNENGVECDFSLIPETIRRTNLNQLKPDSLVNIEFDQLGKMVFTYLENYFHAKPSKQ